MAKKKHGTKLLGETIERIGWPRFFALTDILFTRHHIDDDRGGRESLNVSTHIHF